MILFNRFHQLFPLSSFSSSIGHISLFFSLIYKATKVGIANFNLKYVIENVETPITLDVLATCLEVVSAVDYYQADKTISLSPNIENVIDFGHVRQTEKYTSSTFSYKYCLGNAKEEALFQLPYI